MKTTRQSKASGTERDIVSAAATKALNKLGFAPRRVDFLGGKTFQATFARDENATACAAALNGLGRVAQAEPSRFGDDAFVTFRL